MIVLDSMLRGSVRNLEELLGCGALDLREGDVCCDEAVASAVEGADTCIHLAALRIPRCEERPEECVRVMVEGTRRLLEACVRAKVRNVVFASSVAVYGEPARLPVKEEDRLAPRTLYGAAKIMGEQLVRRYGEAHELGWAILRYFNVFGPGMGLGPHGEVLVKWMEACTRGVPPKVHGDGTTTLDIVYVEDTARATVLASVSPSTEGGTFNVATGREVTLFELATKVCERLAPGLTPVTSPDQASTTAPRMYASTRAAREALGFKAEFSLEDGLDRLADWYRQVREKGD